MSAPTPEPAAVDLDGILADIEGHLAELPQDVVCCVGCHIALTDAPELIRRARQLGEVRADAERYRRSLPADTADYWYWRKRAERAEGERDAARAEADRLRPVVEQRDKLVGVIAHLVGLPPAKIAEIYQVGYGAAVDALGSDAPVDPARTVLDEIAAERQRQDAKWGEQNHPDGTGPDIRWQLPSGRTATESAAYAKRTCQWAADEGRCTWMLILREEIAEAFAEDDPDKLRAELVQVAAVAAQWVEAIDRRGGDPR